MNCSQFWYYVVVAGPAFFLGCVVVYLLRKREKRTEEAEATKGIIYWHGERSYK